MQWEVPQLFADRPLYKTNARKFPYRKPEGLILYAHIGGRTVKYFFDKNGMRYNNIADLAAFFGDAMPLDSIAAIASDAQKRFGDVLGYIICRTGVTPSELYISEPCTQHLLSGIFSALSTIERLEDPDSADQAKEEVRAMHQLIDAIEAAYPCQTSSI